MKPSVLFTYSLLFTAASALAAPDPNRCVPDSMNLKPHERGAYIDSCMAQVSAPENVRESFERSKLRFCEQNLKNMKLKGAGRSGYLSTCMTSNEAEVAARESMAKEATLREAAVETGKCACTTVAQAASDPPSRPAMRKKMASVTCKKPGKKARSEARKEPASKSSKA